MSGVHSRRRTPQLTVVPNSQELTRAEIEVGQLRRFNESLLRYTNVAVILIDRLIGF